MGKVIIGVHGLANKPPRNYLQQSWLPAMQEGLDKNTQSGKQISDNQFEICYWANVLHKHPKHDRDDHRDNRFDFEPYKPANEGELVARNTNALDFIRAYARDKAGDLLDYAIENTALFKKIEDSVLSNLKLTQDLDYYYTNTFIDDTLTTGCRLALQLKIATLLWTHLQAGNEIMLIGHSMGSIIAYDTLRNLGRPGELRNALGLDGTETLDVDQFITLGSPLGFSTVQDHVVKDAENRGSQGEKLRTPSLVKGNWINYADFADPISADAMLADEYKANARGISVTDDLVDNTFYTFKKWGDSDSDKKKNPHKIYGYLRTPEFSQYLESWLP